MSSSCHEIKHKDVGTEMTPLGSSKTTRCHTPIEEVFHLHGIAHQLIDAIRFCHIPLEIKGEEEEEVLKRITHSDTGNAYVFRIRELLHGMKRKAQNSS
ncbi:hypothetical protein V6N11_065122 [Hibiscus sabdariffa]|uniref:Uncharacterized protein n=2 Tax=Hibiscus sabdariffa TaxID=183260 RepID=A0ABR2AHS9_9ROSI